MWGDFQYVVFAHWMLCCPLHRSGLYVHNGDFWEALEIAPLSSYYISVLWACSRQIQCPNSTAAQRIRWRGGTYPRSSGPALRSSWKDGENEFIKAASSNSRPEVIKYLVHESLQQRIVIHVLLLSQGTGLGSCDQWKDCQPVATLALPIT